MWGRRYTVSELQKTDQDASVTPGLASPESYSRKPRLGLTRAIGGYGVLCSGMVGGGIAMLQERPGLALAVFGVAGMGGAVGAVAGVRLDEHELAAVDQAYPQEVIAIPEVLQA